MATVIYSSLGDLERDMRTIGTEFKPRMAEAVRDTAKDGNKAATRLAQRSEGAHGKYYHRAFSVERRSPLEYEWGPDASMPQGGMSFEGGSRNQPPHHDIAQAADIFGANDLALRADRVLDKLFWP